MYARVNIIFGTPGQVGAVLAAPTGRASAPPMLLSIQPYGAPPGV